MPQAIGCARAVLANPCICFQAFVACVLVVRAPFLAAICPYTQHGHTHIRRSPTQPDPDAHASMSIGDLVLSIVILHIRAVFLTRILPPTPTHIETSTHPHTGARTQTRTRTPSLSFSPTHLHMHTFHLIFPSRSICLSSVAWLLVD
ncbi:uncharacterized protein K489DRAFT_263872 [Dissoconium aciculare CBS 342.82]|uniref:Uncharacterized protein n=1 Tax=Dissoconium aciculare CBS 342.82 TaxID=1314786 RepID=A0A6J3LZ50_9PEZI|nr:uncharacterized protein K489DRAFT_263872 [Dissoconium aciculare CBS 342.82]KAF1821050.1 hypothetical protein K489DRAFT_263872 [Dissoconium aciculare CBS 342.82]